MTSDKDLKPCPFCRSAAREWRQGIVRKKLCACSNSECGAYFSNNGFTPEEWNTRPAAPVDTEALKHIGAVNIKGVRTNDYKKGWNDCIDHLHQRGLIRTQGVSEDVQAGLDGLDRIKEFFYIDNDTYFGEWAKTHFEKSDTREALYEHSRMTLKELEAKIREINKIRALLEGKGA